MKRFLLTLLLIFSVPSTAYSVHTILSVGDSKLDIRDAAGNSQLRVDPLTGGGFWNIKEGGLLRIGPTNINQPNTDVQIGSAGAGSSTSLHGNISFLGASVTNISPFILLHRLSLSIPGETGELRFGELFPAANYIGFKAPDSVPADLIWTLPPSDGTSGQVLSTDGSGILSWTTDSEGVTNHGALAGLADDDHTQYALLSGRTGGQTLVGPLIITDPFSATGGVKTTSGDFTVHTFTSSGTFAPNGPGNVEVLVVGAGGGSLGGGAGGGGGGGGEVVENLLFAVTSSPLTVTIGLGVSGDTGGVSVFGSITATGGAFGTGNTGTGGTSGNGFVGGIGATNSGGCTSTLDRLGGGGGGASVIGTNAISPNAGNGGDGVQSSISGISIFYGGGGGGGAERGTAGNGGQGGGADGGAGTGGAAGNNGDANTGGGSGGGGGVCNVIGTSASTGGSGIVIVRYLTVLENIVIDSFGITHRGDMIPAIDGTQDLGSETKRYRDLFLTGNSLNIGGETLSIVGGALQFSGSGGFSSPAALPEWLDLIRTSGTGNQSGIVTGTDIVMDSSRGNGISYNTTTGVVSLKAGRTYRLFATFAVFSIEGGDTVAIEWVNASDNTPLFVGHETRIRPANAPSNGSNAGTIEAIYRPTVDTDVKLRCTEYTHNSDTVTMYWERSMATVIEIR